jgi:hypothetical protein
LCKYATEHEESLVSEYRKGLAESFSLSEDTFKNLHSDFNYGINQIFIFPQDGIDYFCFVKNTNYGI